jgi:hypothetical protein
MDQHHLPALTRALACLPSRRDVLRGFAGAGLGLGFPRLDDVVDAKKKRKHKKPKLKRNEFGCVDVGGKCLGNNANCCSGICDGKKPKKGKKGKQDTSVCVAHGDAGICFPDNDSCTFGKGAGVPCNFDNISCACVLTTGNAGFCGELDFSDGQDAVCRECARNTDCQDEFGPGAACVFFGGACSVICPDTGRTACIRPCPEEAP